MESPVQTFVLDGSCFLLHETGGRLIYEFGSGESFSEGTINDNTNIFVLSRALC